MALSAATGLLLYAKYPLLPAARDHVRAHGPDLETLAGDLVYGRVRERGEARLRDALEHGHLQPAPLASEGDAERELFSFPAARLLAKCLGDEFLMRRWAAAEARRMGQFLRQDPLDASLALAEALGVPFDLREEERGPRLRLHFADYLLHAPPQKEWKLMAQDLVAGHLDLAPEAFAALLEHGLRERLLADFEAMPEAPREVRKTLEPVLQRLRPVLAEARGRFEGPRITGAEPHLFPPCMTKIMNDMATGAMVAHSARFAIVAFLHNLGMDSEAILQFFTRLPNFNPEKSRYQIEHITGKTSPTEYSPPSCSTMQSHNVCPLDLRDQLCFRIKHPLSYYEARWRRREREGPAAAPPAPAPGPATGASPESGPRGGGA